MSTRLTRLIAFFALALTTAAGAASTQHKKSAAPRAPTYEEIRAKQSLGRVIASPTGTFFLYEWLRPYNWVRDTGSLPASAADRMQAWLYKVDVDILPTTSQYLFHPGSGASYWLGDLSPDNNRVAFYELDNDYNVVKAGVWSMTDSKLTWFDATPDASRLEQRPVWVSNDEVVYPAKADGAKFVRANANTGAAKACADCASLIENAQAVSKAEQKSAPERGADSADAASGRTAAQSSVAATGGSGASAPNGDSIAVRGGSAASSVSSGGSTISGASSDSRDRAASTADLGPDARVLAISENGELVVFAKDTNDMLALYFKKGSSEEPEVVFENKRR